MAGNPIILFADGAAKGNPGSGGWGVVIATPDGRVTELGGGTRRTTNNRMELTGAIEALSHLRHTVGTIDFYTDSTYLIRGITRWIDNWKRRGWKTYDGRRVLNRTHWETLAELVAARGKNNRITWHYVRGHSRVPGNDRADSIAVAHAAGRRIKLYRGPVRDYSVPLRDVPDDTSLPEQKGRAPSTKNKQRAYSYLSVVKGRPMRHSTWTDCESRVKGQSGARFKKAATAEDEAAILAEWGFTLDDL